MERQSDESLAGSDFLPGFNGAAMQWALWPMQFWLQWQANMLKAVAPTTAEWMERRRQGTEAALHALDRLCACHSAAEASKVQSEWLKDEAKRLETDMRAFGNSALRLSEEAAKASRSSHEGRAAA
jgi:hypothetical protein